LFKLRFKIPVRVQTAFYLFERAEAFPSIFGSSCSLKKENDIAATGCGCCCGGRGGGGNVHILG